MEGLFVLIPLMAIAAWTLIIHLDKKRITEDLEERGDSVLSVNWHLFGKGWLSESNKNGGGNRIYRIQYKDLYGNKKEAWCKTAMLSGVFISDETIIEKAQADGHPLTPEEKIAILEDEVRKLRKSEK